jgi:hypothetical protein
MPMLFRVNTGKRNQKHKLTLKEMDMDLKLSLREGYITAMLVFALFVSVLDLKGR